jgi:hypothetical protein
MSIISRETVALLGCNFLRHGVVLLPADPPFGTSTSAGNILGKPLSYSILRLRRGLHEDHESSRHIVWTIFDSASTMAAMKPKLGMMLAKDTCFQMLLLSLVQRKSFVSTRCI